MRSQESSTPLFKKVTFNNLKPGEYLIKIYKENPFLKDSRQFIGYKTIKLENDKSTHEIRDRQSDEIIQEINSNLEGNNYYI